MYQVDRRDRVTEIPNVPQSSVGAPLPLVMADEHRLLLAYLAEQHDPNWDGTYVRAVDHESDEPVVLVTFERPMAHMLGPPNDEAFSGHPLAARGLTPYGVFEVEQSSWVRGLERINRVHPYHRPDAFRAMKHFVFAFHDSTFECIARSFNSELLGGPLSRAGELMQSRLFGRQ